MSARADDMTWAIAYAALRRFSGPAWSATAGAQRERAARRARALTRIPTQRGAR